jgi:hypothetical protein
MAVPILTPASTLSAIVLPSAGNLADVASALPFGIYSNSPAFISGATDQVAYVYKKLGGDILDIELTTGNVYAAYEEAVLEYSYLINLHQSQNALPALLGKTTGTFDQDGELTNNIGGKAELAYPKFNLDITRRYGDAFALEAGIGMNSQIYSASIPIREEVQDYDIQAIIQSASLNNYDPATKGPVAFSGSIAGKKITVRRFYYKTPASMWRFFGYYGGLNVIGNLSTYGQYADDSSFEVVPAWHNKLQAMAYETSIYTRNSHYSYEIINNKLRIFPVPNSFTPEYFWIDFSVQEDGWKENIVLSGSTNIGGTTGVNGINNMNTLPFANIPYENINSIGKQWIRRFCLALCKEILGQVRSKFSTIPIPGESVTLNGPALISEAKEQQEKLREELKTILEKMTYPKLTEQVANESENIQKVASKVPFNIFVG